jgi:alcohol dehydrogenase, propanol-preferring
MTELRSPTKWQAGNRPVSLYGPGRISRHRAMDSTRHIQMQRTYRAVEVSAPGVLHVVERQISEPGSGQVRIRVEACGICHTDAATINGAYPDLTLPRVPGHEVVGRVDALGSGVTRWRIGQRVGVGLIAGEDGTCEPCRRGDMVNCQNPVVFGVTVDGGYAEVMIAEARLFPMNSVRKRQP